MAEESIDTREGYNTAFEFTDQTGLPSGMYIVVLKCNDKGCIEKKGIERITEPFIQIQSFLSID